MNPVFSIILPFFNREKSIFRAITSILNQNFGSWELIAVDDGSTDTAASKIRSLSDSRIRLLSNSENLGAAASRNKGIKNCRGEFICFLDSDDEFEPIFLESVYKKWKDVASDVGLIWTGCKIFRNPDNENKYEEQLWTPELAQNPYQTFLRELRIGTNSGISIRRAVFEKISGFNPELPAAEDTEFFLRLSQSFAFDYVPAYLINIYQTGKDRLSLKFDRIAIAYNKFIPNHLSAILRSKALRLKFFYKLMWLNFHLGEVSSARRYFRLLLHENFFHPNGWLVFFIFTIFGTSIGARIHIRLSKSTRF